MASAWIDTNRSALARRARALRSLQRDEVVAVAREHGLHAGLRVDARRQRLGDLRAPRLSRACRACPDAPGSTPPCPASIAITMSRPESVGACAGRMATGAAGAAGVTDDGSRGSCAGRRDVEHQAMAGIARGRGQREVWMVTGPVHFEHQAQAAVRQLARAHRGDRRLRPAGSFDFERRLATRRARRGRDRRAGMPCV